MTLIEPRTLKGFHDRLPDEAGLKESICEKFRAIFRSFGLLPIETPHLEYLDILTGAQGGEEISKQIFHFVDKGNRDVGLRFDLTVPLARYISQYRSKLGLPFKRYAIGSVFRGEKPQAGRYREFTQCDFDIIGNTDEVADAEILHIVCACLEAVNVSSYTIKINHRLLMEGVASKLGMDDVSSFLRGLDKLDKIGTQGVIKELKETTNSSEEKITEALRFVSLSEKFQGKELFKEILSYGENDQRLILGVKHLEETLSLVDSHNIKIDLSIARGLGYYTGLVYETTLTDMPDIGSISSGGRYDNLTGQFSKEVMPGIGGSVGLDRLLVYLEKTKKTQTSVKVLIPREEDSDLRKLFSAAIALRKRAPCVEVYPCPDKLKKQFEYSERRGFSHLLFVGKDCFRLRNATTREEKVFKDISDIIF